MNTSQLLQNTSMKIKDNVILESVDGGAMAWHPLPRPGRLSRADWGRIPRWVPPRHHKYHYGEAKPLMSVGKISAQIPPDSARFRQISARRAQIRSRWNLGSVFLQGPGAASATNAETI